MSVTNAIKQFAVMKVSQICTVWKDKDLPNWARFEDCHSWGFRVKEGDLTFQISAMIYPVKEIGPGNFLVKVVGSLLTQPVIREGYEIVPVPVTMVEIDFTQFAEGEKELQNGVLQLINDEAENIMCQLLADV